MQFEYLMKSVHIVELCNKIKNMPSPNLNPVSMAISAGALATGLL